MKTLKKRISLNEDGSLCSGYKIFPDGSKCKDCIDCEFGKSKKSIQQVFNESHTMLIIKKKSK